MISTTRKVSVIDVEVDDELDFVDDEIADNELAIIEYARVLDVFESEDEFGFPEVNLITTQGSFVFPYTHWLKVKIVE